MAKTKHIHNPQSMVTDFFTLESGSLIFPKNPHNIAWLIQNATEEELKKIDIRIKNTYEQEALASIEMNRKFLIEDKAFFKSICSDRNIANRLENLAKEHGASIKNLGLAITKTNRILTFKKIIELGMDVNYNVLGNSTLRNALKLRKIEMANILWNHPNIDKTYLDATNRNYVYYMLEKINIDLAKQAFKEKPEMFLHRDKNDMTVFHALRMYQNNIKHKENDLFDLVIEIQQYTSTYGITLETPDEKGLIITKMNNFLKEIQEHFIFLQLENKMPQKFSQKKKNKI